MFTMTTINNNTFKDCATLESAVRICEKYYIQNIYVRTSDTGKIDNYMDTEPLDTTGWYMIQHGKLSKLEDIKIE